MGHIQRLSTVFVVALLFLAGTADARSEQRSFDVRPGGQLEIDTDRGRIHVSTSNKDRVTVEVEINGSKANRFDVDFQQRGDSIIVRGDYDGSSFWNWGNNLKVVFEVTVPRRFDLDLDTSGGSIRVSDLDGDVQAKTSGGSLFFGNISGTVRGRTSGGTIELDGSQGDTEVKTSGGSIRIGEVDGQVYASTSGGSIHIDHASGEVEASTSGGSIRVDEVRGSLRASTSGGSVKAYISEQPTANCRLTTSGGRVDVHLAEGIAVDIDAHSSGGGVRSDFNLDNAQISKNTLKGEINGGGPQLYLRSSGGGVSVRRH